MLILFVCSKHVWISFGCIKMLIRFATDLTGIGDRSVHEITGLCFFVIIQWWINRRGHRGVWQLRPYCRCSLSWVRCEIFTHRRSVAKRDGCFQRCLFVSLFVSVFVRMITSERLNIGQPNLAIRYTVQKSRPSSKVKVRGQRSRSPGTKKRKTAESSPLTMHSNVCTVDGTQQTATDDTIAWPLGGDRLRR